MYASRSRQKREGGKRRDRAECKFSFLWPCKCVKFGNEPDTAGKQKGDHTMNKTKIDWATIGAGVKPEEAMKLIQAYIGTVLFNQNKKAPDGEGDLE